MGALDEAGTFGVRHCGGVWHLLPDRKVGVWLESSHKSGVIVPFSVPMSDTDSSVPTYHICSIERH